MAMVDPNKRVLELLYEQGDIAAVARPVNIWLYGNRDELSGLERKLEQLGWRDCKPRLFDDVWVIIAERDQPATEEAISAMAREIESLVEDTDVDFDGWETRVENRH
ncbi:MAG: ribonuclease E inhibitor RraB [Sphingomonadales bacterium]|nr:ribonuclease E inhibitor RraB [Sphingomonadales bacterium]